MTVRHIRRRRSPIVLLAIALLTACSQGGGTDGAGGSCALRAQLDGRWYFAHGGISVIPAYGDPLGSAVVPSCGGGGGFQIEALRIAGVRPEVAFASPDYEDSIFIADGMTSLPRKLERLRGEPRCINGDTPISLHGPWLGIIGADGKTETDLVPPYDLRLRVDAASAARYERAFLTIHVGRELGRPLGREDLRSSLWEGGSLSVTATCIDRRLWAEHVTASPPS